MTAILRDTDQVPGRHRSTDRVAPTHLVLMLVLFWSIVLATTLVTLWEGFTASPLNMLRPIALGMIGASLSGLIAVLLDRLRQESLALRVPVGLVGALAASTIYAVASVPILTPALDLTRGSMDDPVSILRLIASNFWIFAAWSVLYLLLDLSTLLFRACFLEFADDFPKMRLRTVGPFVLESAAFALLVVPEAAESCSMSSDANLLPW